MRIGGYEITRTSTGLLVEEVCGEQTKSCRVMLEFCDRFPVGDEPQWDAFVVKHTAMQRKEIDSSINEFLKSETGD
jgi:hypothetical protein